MSTIEFAFGSRARLEVLVKFCRYHPMEWT